MASSTYKGFKTDDRMIDKSDYYAWKMSVDLVLEDQEVMDYVQGKVNKPPSNALASTKTKYRRGEVKAKMIITYSIHKHLLSYISERGISKEMYDKLVSLFRARNANQVLFFKNKLKNIMKGKEESIQSYFMRPTEIMNDLLAIGEELVDRELVLIALGGLPRDWYVFNTTILNNNVIPDFDELLTRCTQEETRMMERDNPSNGNGGDPTAFTAHAKKRKAPSDRSGNGQPFKRSRNSRYDESNFVDNKKNEYILIYALSAASPLDTLDVWLIDSGTSRHLTSYKESLSDLIEKDINL